MKGRKMAVILPFRHLPTSHSGVIVPCHRQDTDCLSRVARGRLLARFGRDRSSGGKGNAGPQRGRLSVRQCGRDAGSEAPQLGHYNRLRQEGCGWLDNRRNPVLPNRYPRRRKRAIGGAHGIDEDGRPHYQVGAGCRDGHEKGCSKYAPQAPREFRARFSMRLAVVSTPTGGLFVLLIVAAND